MNDNIKETAFDKIWVYREYNQEDIEIWNYILTLIEKDRT
jgi:hypothetical protein